MRVCVGKLCRHAAFGYPSLDSHVVISLSKAYRIPEVQVPTPKQQRRRALELLAGSRDGCTEAIMLAHGFKTELLVDLINARLATAQTERMVAGGRWVEVIRFRITEAGRRALSHLRWP